MVKPAEDVGNIARLVQRRRKAAREKRWVSLWEYGRVSDGADWPLDRMIWCWLGIERWVKSADSAEKGPLLQQLSNSLAMMLVVLMALIVLVALVVLVVLVVLIVLMSLIVLELLLKLLLELLLMLLMLPMELILPMELTVLLLLLMISG